MAFTAAELADIRKKSIADKEKAAEGGKYITDYVILTGKTEAGLVSEVKKHLSKGYEPLGGVAAAAFGISPVGGNRFIQAMIKRGNVRDRSER